MSNRIHPLTKEPKNGKPRKELVAVAPAKRTVRATYDAARTSDDNSRYWANADHYDADSANSRGVRETLVARSRYEIANNGYADGIAQTYSTDLVGVGPKLRMQTGSTGFNQMIEVEFYRWSKAVNLRRKLWCMAHAKISDGEAFAVLRTNPRVNHPVKLDVCIYETEQCRSPYMPAYVPGYIDGIRFDEFGNVEWYEFVKYHPGGQQGAWGYEEPERVPAKYVLHWFLMRRPGQHRGVPELSSTLNTGAAARRWREATLGAAETAAEFTMFLKTQQMPDEMDTVTPMSTLDIEKRMMTALPAGYDPFQMRAEHPTAQYEAFHKSLVNEMARPKSMPYNKAACDSSSYNYASGRLDHQTYYGSLDVDREDGNDLVLDPLFTVWFDEAVRSFGWLGGDPRVLNAGASSHLWDWPKHRVADIESEANATDKKLKNGTASLSAVYSDAGLDFEDEVSKMADDYGKTVDEMREILLATNYPSGAQQPEPTPVEVMPEEMEPDEEDTEVETEDESSDVAAMAFELIRDIIEAYRPGQARDRRGRWASGRGGGPGARTKVGKFAGKAAPKKAAEKPDSTKKTAKKSATKNASPEKAAGKKEGKTEPKKPAVKKAPAKKEDSEKPAKKTSEKAGGASPGKEQLAARKGSEADMAKREEGLKSKRQLGQPPSDVSRRHASDGIETYSNEDDFRDINGALRSGKSPGEISPEMDALQKLSQQELDQPTTVYRGIKRSTFERTMGQAGEGGEIEMKGFVSTSIDPKVATDFASKSDDGLVLEIRAKRGLYIADKGFHPDEKEIVQAHGTKYRMLGVQKKQTVGGKTVDVVMLEEV